MNKEPKINNIVVSEGYVIIEPYKAEKKTASGLINPRDYANDKASMGKIVGVGEGIKLPIGATVFFNKYSFTEIEYYRNEKYISLRIEDIIAWHK